MKKTFFSIMLFSVSIVFVNAQTTKSFYTEFGISNSSFQDLKFSAVSYRGSGGILRIGWNRNNPKYSWDAGLNINYGIESANTHDAASVNAIQVSIYGRYLRAINPNLFIGAHLDLANLNVRIDSELGNNGNYYISSSDLFASGVYKKGKISFGMDLGLLSFFSESTGFAFSVPQKVLEDGKFNYQDEGLGEPFDFRNSRLGALYNHLNLRTKISYELSNRFSVGYQWSLRHFAEVKDYSVTIGNHQVLLKYNFTHRTKTKTTKTEEN